eukprot:4138852-Lingulodinium_polyedra.AAC.1
MLYIWQFAACVAHGCQLASKRSKKGLLYLAYPVAERDRPDPDADWRKCFGCLGRADKTDPRHSRVPGECKWPLIESIQWD